MSVAVTFCAQPENERRDNERGYSSFRWSEAKSLCEAIEFGAPVRLQLQLTTNDTNRHEFRKRAVERKSNRRLPACTTESKPFCNGNRIGRSSLFVFIRGCLPFAAAGSESSGSVV